MVSIEQKYENMRKKYRACQDELKAAKKLMKEYDGSHALDQWDEDLMPSKGWVSKITAFLRRK